MKKSSIGKSGLVVFISSALASVFMYLFYLYMGKTLGPERYSVLGVLLSIFFIFTVTTNVISIILVRYVTYFEAKNQYGKIKSIFQTSLKVVFYAGVLFFVILLIFSRQIASLLKIQAILPIILLGLLIWSFSLMIVFFSILNGLQKFGSLGAGKVGEALITLFLGIALVLLGFGVNGAMLALLLGVIFSIPIALFSLKFLSNVKITEIGKTDIKKYILLASSGYFAIAVILNAGLILVKLYFNELEAGYFAAASVLGSIPFFISSSMTAVLFPKISELYSNGKDTLFILRKGLFYTGVPCFIIILIYFLFPDFISHLLFGGEYKISSYIGLYALAMSLLAISSIIVIYNLALKRRKIAYLLTPFAIFQILLIMIFHSTLMQVIVVMLILNAMLLTALCYMFREELMNTLKLRKSYLSYPIRIPFRYRK